MIAQVLHIPPEQQDRLSVTDFDAACDYLDETGAIEGGHRGD